VGINPREILARNEVSGVNLGWTLSVDGYVASVVSSCRLYRLYIHALRRIGQLTLDTAKSVALTTVKGCTH